ncbi:type II toxin-antitoxin system VapC family toxin [Nocardioides humi]|uniref:Ribonuclease VapC n=1 Tax=Nocardioides humi TaxID=449461 RepID=A0ABN2APS7_9ACTN|nr:type II toxin-antitoxin system VapC family toxin [Nocardioides humi]
MIAVDAGVVIAVLDELDAHNEAAFELLLAAGDQRLVMGPVTRAEALVGATRRGRTAEAIAQMDVIGIEEIPLPTDAAVRLAELRATTGVKMPDCCLLLVAQQTGSALATFDHRLRSAARSLGLAVLPDDEEPDPRS